MPREVRARKYHSPHMNNIPPRADAGFAYSRADFENLVDSALAHASKLGATDAGAEASEGCGLSVSVRKGELENVERNRDKSLGITVYVGHRRGNASTSDFSRGGHRADRAGRLRHRPLHRRRPGGRPARRGRHRRPDEQPDLDLFHPWDVDQRAGGRAGARMRSAPPSPPTSASPTAKARASRRSRAISSARTRTAFAAAMPARAIRSRWRRSPARATTCSATPGTARCARPTSWPSPRPSAATPPSARWPPEVAQDQAPRECPVLFESPLAAGLLGGFVQATSGGALYRKSTFLLDSLGKQVLPEHVDVRRRPASCRAARAAPPSTTKACAPRARKVVDARPASRATSSAATRRASSA